MLHLTVVGGEHCRRAKELKRRLKSAAERVGVAIHIEEATDVLDPLRFALLGLPGLLIEGEFIMAGDVPSEKALTNLLHEHAGSVSPAEGR